MIGAAKMDTAHLIAALAAQDVDGRACTVMRLLAKGEATWTSPTTPGVGRAPATHFHEITIDGMTGFGETGPEAIANWITVAKRMTSGPDETSFTPNGGPVTA